MSMDSGLQHRGAGRVERHRKRKGSGGRSEAWEGPLPLPGPPQLLQELHTTGSAQCPLQQGPSPPPLPLHPGGWGHANGRLGICWQIW